MINMYRKKPIVIVAIQFLTGDEGVSATEIMDWMSINGGKSHHYPYAPAIKANNGEYVQFEVDEHMVISTHEGIMRANANDWVIKGVNGEFYPCKPDIFDKTYEAVSV